MKPDDNNGGPLLMEVAMSFADSFTNICSPDASPTYYYLHFYPDPLNQSEQVRFVHSGTDIGPVALSAQWETAFLTDETKSRLKSEIRWDKLAEFQQSIYSRCANSIDYMRQKLLAGYMELIKLPGEPNSLWSARVVNNAGSFEISIYRQNTYPENEVSVDPNVRHITIRGYVDRKGVYYVTIDDTAYTYTHSLPQLRSKEWEHEVILLIAGRNGADNFTEEVFLAFQKEAERLVQESKPAKKAGRAHGK